jgi:ABC-type hemin transport system ATPase subunit
MINIENLRLTIEGKEILNGIDMHLRPGDIYGTACAWKPDRTPVTFRPG